MNAGSRSMRLRCARGGWHSVAGGGRTGRRTPLRAARLFGAAEALRETLGAPRLAIYRGALPAGGCQPAEPARRDRVRGGLGGGTGADVGAGARRGAGPAGRRSSGGRRTALDGQADGSARPRQATHLTAREVEVLSVVAEGATDQEVAARLGLRPRTVTTYLTRIYAKLDVRTRTAAVRVAREQHLI